MRLTLLSPALREVVEALEHYEGQSEGLGQALDADLVRSLDFIREDPLLGSPFEGGTRRILLGRFPYAIIYSVLQNRVVVVAFAHQRQRPGYWKDRL